MCRRFDFLLGWLVFWETVSEEQDVPANYYDAAERYSIYVMLAVKGWNKGYVHIKKSVITENYIQRNSKSS